MSEMSVRSIAHGDLSDADLESLGRLFDDEYFSQRGEWDPDHPYGYAPHDVHVVAQRGRHVVAHVGWGRRSIAVGGSDVEVAGVGGVLVSHRARVAGVGRMLMEHAASTMRTAGGIELGHLGCREAVAPFYEACGWHRVSAVEHFIGRDGAPAVQPPGPPILIQPVGRTLDAWPAGNIDLRGRAW